ncbi:polyamine aminopropyltransferase [Caldanaerobius polysaccharolyticus]|uniref:polyamine aminopropyltransferase n=1 Tax=Caldanaerobius polysaccharolyticus TaxID=44256 RepID=UPI00047DD483|nr:polyamine aminopropyltransferase [Caldanaerobius polysaccharolyticus]
MAKIRALLISVFLVALCGIVYELSIGNVSTYLLGNSVLQYSLTIGFFMFSMGIGSYLSKYIKSELISIFIYIELSIAAVGGTSSVLLFYSYGFTNIYTMVMILITAIIGIMEGLEIPVITRIIEENYRDIKISLSHVLSFDYLGALIGSLAFSLVLIPRLGIITTPFVFALLNLFVAAINIWVFYSEVKRRRWLVVSAAITGIILVAGIIFSPKISNVLEQKLYSDPVVLVKQTPYQKLVITRRGDDLRLYIDGNLQFSSVDEYRYHEALVLPAMSLLKDRSHVLIIGGGDGLAAREVLKYDDVKSITLVDLDKGMTDLFSKDGDLIEYNKNSLNNPKVNIVNQDGFKYLEKTKNHFNFIIVDLPDPNSEELSRLYSLSFYRLMKKHLTDDGIAVVQSTSPYFAPKVFWSINKTIKAAGLNVYPYHLNVPSFGDWGFNMASKKKLNIDDIKVRVKTRYLDDQVIKAMFSFGKDEMASDVGINRITNPIILRYYQESWKHW